ncbi:hypothetical protein OCU04_001205 [Sclerotinia nivalis]|uniref:Uncharacterized protein n=1 Tax=Sclerotinia nivalis TaxID=352851 RepID=A0A9X0AXN0_9HELO|nr:hypothetical protein OCU04_001205 [Sclerotinia nivalis]
MNNLMPVIVLVQALLFAATVALFRKWMQDTPQPRAEDAPETGVIICTHHYIFVELPEPDAINQPSTETESRTD